MILLRERGVIMKKILVTGLVFAIMLSLFVPMASAAALEYTLSPSIVNLDASQTGSFQLVYESDGLPFAGVDCDLLLPADVEITGVKYDGITTGFEGIGTSEGSGITNFSKSALSDTCNGPVACTVSIKYNGTGAVLSSITIIRVRIIRYAPTGVLHTVQLSPAGGANQVSIVANTVSTAPDSADLASLAVSPGALSPAFSPDELAYVVTVGNDVTSVNVTAAAKYPATATVEITGGASLSVGNSNTVTVKVTANDGEVKTYTILVSRLESGATPPPAQSQTPTPPTAQTPEPPPSEEITPTPAPTGGFLPFDDVGVDDWFYGDVYYVWEKELMNGTSENMFSPGITLSRGMVATVLYRMEGEPDVTDLAMPFTDVAAGKWYYNAVKWAADNDIALGFDDDTYRPDDNVTREQLAALLSRYADYAGDELPAKRDYAAFPDQDTISAYALAPVEALYKAGIINGRTNGSFDPKGNATRAEFAAMIHRYCESA